jgi:sigma-B regulation protein RsbU (phosphoserine phosphatase)
MEKTARLKVTDSFGVKKTIPLLKPVFTIGRMVDNDLQVMSNTASRRHGSIVCENGVYYLIDNDSTSGTFINGKRIKRTPLNNLDRITLGEVNDYQIQFIASDAATGGPLLSGDQPRLDSTSGQPAATAEEQLKNLARYVEINQAFKFSLTPDDVLRLIVDAAIELAAAERGLIMLRNSKGSMSFKIARDNKKTDVQRRDFALSTSVVRKVLHKKRTVVLNVSENESAADPSQSVMLLGLRTAICIPLLRFQMQQNMNSTSTYQPELIGILYLDSRMRGGGNLSQTSMRLLESLGFEASKALESVRLMHEEEKKQRMEREFETAREVQVALMPISAVKTERFDLVAHSLPCRYVGGDFYDLIKLPNGVVSMTLADVSGKGISAALLASVAQGVIEAQFSSEHTPAEVVETLNRVIVSRSDANRFITMFSALLDDEGNLAWVNAGHNPPILARRDGRTEELATKSLVIGAFDFAEYRVTNTKLESGDVVFCFTDGVTEAANSSGEMFGDERLLELIRKNLHSTAEQIRDLVLEEVVYFTSGLPQGDDVTVIALKMK